MPVVILDTPGFGQWVCPPGAENAIVEIASGPGGGGGAGSDIYGPPDEFGVQQLQSAGFPGGGGAGGSGDTIQPGFLAGNTYDYYIGARGEGGAIDCDGTNGEATIFNGTVVPGGYGGQHGSTVQGSGGASGGGGQAGQPGFMGGDGGMGGGTAGNGGKGGVPNGAAAEPGQRHGSLRISW